MKSLLLTVFLFTAFQTLSLQAAPVSQIFEGVTVSNPAQPAALNAGFPAGTPWTLEAEWENTSNPLFSSGTQASYRLTSLTLTLAGTNGDWTSSAVMDTASVGLLSNGGFAEVQFTSGFNPANLTNSMIGSSTVYSINLSLGDPTGTAVPALNPVPGSFDLADFSASVSVSNLKIYLNEGGTEFILGGLGDSPVLDPNLSVLEKGGQTLQSAASSLRFKATRVRKRSAKTVLILSNTGGGVLSEIATELTGPGKRDFTITTKGNNSLAAGGTYRVEVTFAPKRPGEREATLELSSSDPDEPVFSISLSGKARAAR